MAKRVEASCHDDRMAFSFNIWNWTGFGGVPGNQRRATVPISDECLLNYNRKQSLWSCHTYR